MGGTTTGLLPRRTKCARRRAVHAAPAWLAIWHGVDGHHVSRGGGARRGPRSSHVDFNRLSSDAGLAWLPGHEQHVTLSGAEYCYLPKTGVRLDRVHLAREPHEDLRYREDHDGRGRGRCKRSRLCQHNRLLSVQCTDQGSPTKARRLETLDVQAGGARGTLGACVLKPH